MLVKTKTITIKLRKNKFSSISIGYFQEIPWLEVINLPSHWKEMKNEKIHLLIVFTDL